MEPVNGTAHSRSLVGECECEYYQPVAAADLPEIDGTAYVVERFIAKNEVTSGSGLPKAGKSYVALKIALDVVRGEPFFGQPTAQGVVVYGDAETKWQAWRKRVGKIVRGYGDASGRPPDGLKYMRIEKGSFNEPAKVEKMLVAIKALNPALFILDSFQFATGVNPLDPQKVTEVYGQIARFGTVLVIDHAAYPRQGNEKHTAKAYGSVYKAASVDAYFNVASEVSGENENRLTIEMAGSRDDAPLPAFGAVARFAVDGRSVSFEKCEADPRPATTEMSGKLLAMLQACAQDGGAYERQTAIGQCGGNAKVVANAFTRLKKQRLVGSMTADGTTIWFATKPKVKR